MSRNEFHTDSVKVDQKAPIVGDAKLRNRESDVVLVDKDALNDKAWFEELAFNDEPVTIRIEPSSEKNAASAFPVWCNGKGAEVLIRGKWVEMIYLPVGQILTTKRKYVAIMLGAKIDTIQTVTDEATQENPRNEVKRITTATHSFSIIEDKSPRGAAWATELRRRNF